MPMLFTKLIFEFGENFKWKDRARIRCPWYFRLAQTAIGRHRCWAIMWLIGQRQNLAWAIFCPPFSWCQNVSLISSLFAFEKHLPLILTPKVFKKKFVLGDLCIGIITTFFWSQKCERMWVVKIIKGLTLPNFVYIMGCWFLATSTLGLRLLTWTINNVISADMLYKLYNMLNWVRWGKEEASNKKKFQDVCTFVQWQIMWLA